jgi:hypothetical protein
MYMKTKTMFRLAASCIVSAALLIAGCGGGGSGNGSVNPPPALFVSGTASEGALIKDKTVKLKDATGKFASDATTDATTGIYSINVTGLTAPFIVTVTGTNGTYLSFAQTAGTANINPITTTVVALAAGSPDVSALFANLKPAELSTINANYTAKTSLVTASLQSVLSGVKAEDYFTGTITAGNGIDALFDTYRIVVTPADGVTSTTKDGTITVLVSATTVKANTNDPLPVITAPQVYTQVILKLKTIGTAASGKQVGGWQATVKMPATGISIKTLSAINMMLDATAFFKSGVTPSSFTFTGSYNKADATSTVPYIMISNAGDTANPLSGTATGEVATLVFDIATGAATPVKGDFILTGISVAEAALGVPYLAGVTMDFDISYK